MPRVKKYRRRRPRVIGIYLIACCKTNKVYIGSSKDVFSRLGNHFNQLSEGTHTNTGMQAAWNRYGFKQFSFQVRMVLTLEQAPLLKHYEQGVLDSYEKAELYNLRRACSKDVQKTNLK